MSVYLIGNKNKNPKSYLHPNVQSSIIYNSQDVETTSGIHQWMNR